MPWRLTNAPYPIRRFPKLSFFSILMTVFALPGNRIVTNSVFNKTYFSTSSKNSIVATVEDTVKQIRFICFFLSRREGSCFFPFGIGSFLSLNASCIHFSLFRPHQYSGTDTSHLYAGTRPLAKSDYGYLVFSHSS